MLKSIAALLNTGGGHLIIGQADDGTVLGLDGDFQTLPERSRSRDGLQRALQESVSSSEMGQWINLPLTPSWHNVNGKDVLIVDCRRASHPVWLGGKLYVRQENATIALEGAKLTTYVLERFAD